MAKLKIDKTAAARARSATPAATAAPRRRSAVAIVLGLLVGLVGWTAAGVAGYALHQVMEQGKADQAAFEKKMDLLKEEQAQVQQLNADANAGMLTQINDLNARIKEASAQNNLLIRRVEAARRALTAVQEEVAKSSTSDSLAARELKQKREALAAARQERVALTEKRDALREEKRRLVDSYKNLRKELVDAIESGRRESSITTIRSTFMRYRHSSYAPAAAFFTGEKAVELKDYDEARRYFQVVLDNYGNSPYAKHAKTRLTELGVKLSERKFGTIDIGIQQSE